MRFLMILLEVLFEMGHHFVMQSHLKLTILLPRPPDPEITVGYHTSSHSRFIIATFENISLQWSYCLAQAGLNLMAILPQILGCYYRVPNQLLNVCN